MDRTTDDIISESNKNYKPMNDIPNELEFSSNKNISGNKSKRIPVTSEHIHKVKKSLSVPAAGLSWLWDTESSHCVINQHYVKKFQEDFRHYEKIYETAGGNYKTKYYIKINFTLPVFSETKIIYHQFHINSSKNFWYDVIIRQDLMKKLRIIFESKNKILIWA